MASMSDADREKAARIIGRQWTNAGNVATVNHADIKVAVINIDDSLEATQATLAGTAGQTIAVRFNASLVAPVSGTSQAFRSLVVSVTVAVKYGFLTSGGE